MLYEVKLAIYYHLPPWEERLNAGKYNVSMDPEGKQNMSGENISFYKN